MHLFKSKILANPKGIVWDASKSAANIFKGGLMAFTTTGVGIGWICAIATEGYPISGEHCRKDNFRFPGAIFYYEVKIMCRLYR
jgi:hypothetical protein